VLVGQGLARTKGVFVNLPTGEKAKAYAERLEAMEREARQKQLGVWASAPARRAETETK
jgi:endonuclease YncB( thermonuclease family)